MKYKPLINLPMISVDRFFPYNSILISPYPVNTMNKETIEKIFDFFNSLFYLLCNFL